MSDTKYRIYMTKKHQNWTFGDKDGLKPYLDGPDDEILEFAVYDKDFVIILKNDLTYDVMDSVQEAKDYIAHIYRNYIISLNDGDLCYIARDDLSRRYKTSGDAMQDGVFDYVYVPTGTYFIAKFGKIFGVGRTEDEMYEKMYAHYRAKYTYMS